jgi:uncharacterized protein YkwD
MAEGATLERAGTQEDKPENKPGPLVAPASLAVQSATSPANDAGAFAEQMVVLVNQFRQQNNLPPLKINPALSQAAQGYSSRMGAANFFGHLDPDFNCNKPADRAVAAGYNNWATVGENIAAGYLSPQSAFDGLAGSPGHRANMLNAAYRDIGIGYFFDAADMAHVRQNGACPYTSSSGGPYRHYWAQLMGARWREGVPVLPVIINGESITTAARTVSLYIYGGLEGQPVWAKQMRFSEDNRTWSAYEPWAATKAYSLSAGAGVKTLYVQLSNGSATQTVSDTITLADGSAPEPTPVSTPAPSPTAPPAALPDNMKARVFAPLVVR